jgi:hypothetical protein
MSEQIHPPLASGGADSHVTPSDEHEWHTGGEHDQQAGNDGRNTVRRPPVDRFLEITLAILLGIVAVATTWSSYQAARWNGVESADYSEASALRVKSTRDATLAGQDTLYDVNLFDGWLDAYSSGKMALATIYQRRFRPEFVPAFTAWLATQPFTNPQAPPGPLFMPQYKVSRTAEANQLETRAQHVFATGQVANEWSNDYLLNTVLLATVLLLGAIAERFRWHPVRVAVLVIACAVLLVSVANLVRFPH